LFCTYPNLWLALHFYKIFAVYPILRVQCTNARFYIDENGYMFPLTPKPNLHIPIVTGILPQTIANNYAGYIPENEPFLNNLYNFAVFLQKNEFWNNMIEQININNNKIELIPQIAAHVVILGSLDNFNTKLNKLQKFYKNALPAIGWDKYKTINIEYKNQIICKK
jgi:cell division protein FtsQ